SPLEMPTLAGKYQRDLDWEGKVVQSCVHCHQVGDALRVSFRKEKQPIPEQWIYPFPMPESIGLSLAADKPARVEAVTPGSVADKAGFKAGDDLLTFAGQALVSAADVSWALHRAPAAGQLKATARRGNRSIPLDVTLPADWRKGSDISRRVGTWP